MLNEDFEKSIDDILKAIPRERKTYLFSATMTKKVNYVQVVIDFFSDILYVLALFLVAYAFLVKIFPIINMILWVFPS